MKALMTLSYTFCGKKVKEELMKIETYKICSSELALSKTLLGTDFHKKW